LNTTIETLLKEQRYQEIHKKFNITIININNLEENNECYICYERKTNVKTSCNHMYCERCFYTTYYKMLHVCGFCRQILSNNIILYNH